VAGAGEVGSGGNASFGCSIYLYSLWRVSFLYGGISDGWRSTVTVQPPIHRGTAGRHARYFIYPPHQKEGARPASRRLMFVPDKTRREDIRYEQCGVMVAG
jgi:hypothetical protein